MPYFESWEEIEHFQGGPTVAERKLKEALEGGWPCNLGFATKIPPEPANWSTLDSDRHIRADVLRFFLTQMDSTETTDQGLTLAGAYISGALDIDNARIQIQVRIVYCRFEDILWAKGVYWQGPVIIHNCYLRCIHAPNSVFTGGLDLSGTHLSTSTSFALQLRGSEIEQHLFLADMTVSGGLSLHKLIITGSLVLSETVVASELVDAINLSDSVVKGELVLRKLGRVTGDIVLANARIESLVDDAHSQQAGDRLVLEGLIYDRLYGPTDSVTRLKWLARGDKWNGVFSSQPYKQLAKVLRDMGLEAEAFQINIGLGRRRSHLKREQLKVTPNGDLWVGLVSIIRDLQRLWMRFFHSQMDLFWGYGYAKQRIVLLLGYLILICAAYAHFSWLEGSMVPNSAPILVSPEWQKIAELHPIHTTQKWLETHTGSDWESFNALAYAVDVVVPLIDLGQSTAWAPATDRGLVGQTLWWLRWVLATIGFAVSTIAVAGLSNAFQKD